jgi:ATF/CREB family transcription factor
MVPRVPSIALIFVPFVAIKCRQRRKAFLSQLQQSYVQEASRNRLLLETAHNLREEILRLRAQLIQHKACQPDDAPCAVLSFYMNHGSPSDITISSPPPELETTLEEEPQ